MSNQIEKPEPLMSRQEREDLQRLLRQREKVQKSAAKQRSAELLADFDAQIQAQYSFDDDAVWRQAVLDVKPHVEAAKRVIAEQCQKLGIPPEFAPSISLNWANQGYRNAVKEERAELRKTAQSRIAAMEARAVTTIEAASVEAQTKLALAGVTSEAAGAFIADLPSVDTLMSRLSFDEVAGRASSPLASQLIQPPGLRQNGGAPAIAARDEGDDR